MLNPDFAKADNILSLLFFPPYKQKPKLLKLNRWWEQKRNHICIPLVNTTCLND